MVLIATSHYAAVDVPNGAGNPGRFVRQQKCNRFRNFFGASDTSNWVETIEALKDRVHLLFRNESLKDRSAHDGRRYRVHSDSRAC